LLAQQLRESCERLGVALLRVNCLGACKQPCSIALDATGKPRLRFSGLASTTDCAAVEALIQGYQQSATGDPATFEIPATLRPALSAVSPKPNLATGSPPLQGSAQPQ
jgi:predicted metal-binding protein